MVLSPTSVGAEYRGSLDSVLPKGVAGGPWLVMDRSGEPVGSAVMAGVVTLFPGVPDGVVPSPSATWSQDSPGIRDRAEANDLFGAGGELFGW